MNFARKSLFNEPCCSEVGFMRDIDIYEIRILHEIFLVSV